jgi:hypothetical protein
MRLFDLIYCCRLYGEATGFDASLSRFWEATDGRVDLARAGHRELTLQWLRDWGCRNLRLEDTELTLLVLERWADRWLDALPGAESTLDELTDDDLDATARAYDELAFAHAAHRRHGDRMVQVRFGSTAAAKTLFAIRPRALLPWDEAIRRALGYDGSAGSYRDAIVRARDELNEVVAEVGVPAEQLPEVVGRPLSPPPKLIDEHDWVRHAAGHTPPSEEQLREWLELYGGRVPRTE